MRMDTARWMQGRNGLDDLANAMYVMGWVLFIVQLVTRNVWIHLLAMAAWGYAAFRICSKNIVKRQIENRWYRDHIALGEKQMRLGKRMWRERKTHRFFRCKECGQMVRVPRGHGTIEITCPKCRHRFEAKS